MTGLAYMQQELEAMMNKDRQTGGTSEHRRTPGTRTGRLEERASTEERLAQAEKSIAWLLDYVNLNLQQELEDFSYDIRALYRLDLARRLGMLEQATEEGEES